MGFDAATVVEPLDWDFEKFGGGKGTIPEPSDDKILALFRDMQAVAKSVGKEIDFSDPESLSPEKLLQAMDGLDLTGIMVAALDAMVEAVAKCCSGKPNKTQIKKLPLRVRMKFILWLLEELRPEAAGAGFANQPMTLGPPQPLRLASANGA